MIGYKEQGETDGLRTKLPTEGAREEISYRGVLHLKIFSVTPCVTAVISRDAYVLLCYWEALFFSNTFEPQQRADKIMKDFPVLG